MSETAERNYRDTLNLPKTGFPMKAELPKREPERVRWWDERGTYASRLETSASKPPWILHDGPPYANGELHMGHFLNMVLKDTFVKIALLDGKWANFIPGWDMHGLPIEIETLKHLGIEDFHAIDPLELRARCKERALFWLDRQRDVRKRMGCFGRFDRPYRTIDPAYEATVVSTLADLAEKNQIYKGLRTTIWCVHDETALAEAEIEYEQKTSPAIFVRFAASPQQAAGFAERFGTSVTESPVSVLVWTTTPWTLPANVAIALRPDAVYGLYELGNERIVVATALAESSLGERFADAKLVATARGDALDGLAVRHPFMDRDSVVVLADYVDLETGTGAVHTAPGHGADDFDTGMKYGLPILNPVDAGGHFTVDAGPYAGLQVFAANAKIIDDLRASGALLREEKYEHSYPHCWRCHNPVIFRATAQWFIAMDQNRLRAHILDAIDDVGYVPEWGRNRQRQMIENHPEWCISRQRTWGTPIPAVVCSNCDVSTLDPRVARTTAAIFAERGADAWWSDPVETFLPEGFACPSCGGRRFKKEFNIVDIWFESGVSHLAVLGRDGMPWPSNAVLEGGDQYRGWFRSSLVTGVAVKGAAPYERVVKNGWVNDEQGRPMSKSRGTGFDARDAMDKWGADVLRLWSASVEFVDDVRFGPAVVEQVGRVYRNIRNRIRFMLSNLEDLGVAGVVPRDKMQPFDRLSCAIVDRFVLDVKAFYDVFEIHDAYLRIVELESSLSSLYFDAIKDPLYSLARNDPRRRSAQSALLYALERILTAVAPILSFTAEEAWQELPEALRRGRASVFDTSFLSPDDASPALDEAAALWNVLRNLRATVAASASPRDYEAGLTVSASPDLYGALHALGDNLREAMVVSQLTLEKTEGAENVSAVIGPAAGKKCKRCWKYRDLGTDPKHPDICADCANVVNELKG